MAKEETVYVRCNECRNSYTNHRVLWKTGRPVAENPDGGWDHDEHDQFIQCMGCDAFKYRHYCIGPGDEMYGERIFPSNDPKPGERRVADFGNEEERIPPVVWKMYQETLASLNAKARTLAGGGLRATVEAICRERGIADGNLMQKIDELVNMKLLTEGEAEYLHEERFLGNAALHELETPSSSEIELGLTIIEALLNKIYIVPAKAAELKAIRQKKATTKAAKK